MRDERCTNCCPTPNIDTGPVTLQVPVIKATILDHLATAGTKPQKVMPATPRQSPAEAMFHSAVSDECGKRIQRTAGVLNCVCLGISSKWDGAGGNGPAGPRLQFTASSLESAVLALDALTALFTVVPLSECVELMQVVGDCNWLLGSAVTRIILT